MCGKNAHAIGILQRLLPLGVMDKLYVVEGTGTDAVSYSFANTAEILGVGLGVSGELWWDPAVVCKVKDSSQRAIAEQRVKVGVSASG